MDNLTSNSTNYSDGSSMVNAPAFIAFNVVMLVGFILPAAVLDISILVAFAVDKVTPIQIRFILANFLLVGLVILFLLTLEHLTALVLVTTDLPLPPLDFCSTILWALFGAGALRLMLTASFSIVVFVMIVKGMKAINTIALIVSFIVLWIVCFFSLNIPLLALPGNNAYVDGVACLPVGNKDRMDIVFATIYVLVFGVAPLVVSIVMPITTFVYLFKHKTSESSNVPFLKAMAKLSSLLIVGGLINFIGEVSPALISVVAFSALNASISGLAVFYTSLILLNLSLWPTPILILVYVKSLRTNVKQVVKNCMRCYQNEAEHPSATTVDTEQSN